MCHFLVTCPQPFNTLPAPTHTEGRPGLHNLSGRSEPRTPVPSEGLSGSRSKAGAWVQPLLAALTRGKETEDSDQALFNISLGRWGGFTFKSKLEKECSGPKSVYVVFVKLRHFKESVGTAVTDAESPGPVPAAPHSQG